MFGGNNPSSGSGFGQPGLQPSKNPYASAVSSKTFGGTFTPQTPAPSSNGPSWNQKSTAGTNSAASQATFGSGFGGGLGGGGGFGGKLSSPAPTTFGGLGSGSTSFMTPSSFRPADNQANSGSFGSNNVSAFGDNSKSAPIQVSGGQLFGGTSFAGAPPRSFGGPHYKCRVCQSAFPSSEELKKHIKAENHFDTTRTANAGAPAGGFGSSGPRPTFGGDPQSRGSNPNIAVDPQKGGFGGPSMTPGALPPYPQASSGAAPIEIRQIGAAAQPHSTAHIPPGGQDWHERGPASVNGVYQTPSARGPRGAPGNYTSSNNTGGAGQPGGGQGAGPGPAPGGTRAQPRSGPAGSSSQDVRRQAPQSIIKPSGGDFASTGLPVAPQRAAQAGLGAASDASAGARIYPGNRPPRGAAQYGLNAFTPQAQAPQRSYPPPVPQVQQPPQTTAPAPNVQTNMHSFSGQARSTAHAGTPLPPNVHLSTVAEVGQASDADGGEGSDNADANSQMRDDGDHASDPDYQPGSAADQGDDSESGEDDLNFSFSSQESGAGGVATGGNGTTGADAIKASLRSFGAAPVSAAPGPAHGLQPKTSMATAARAPVKNISASQFSASGSASDSESGSSSAGDSSDAMGTCEDMCPAQERQKRLNESDIHKLEIPHPEMTPGRLDYADTMVKKFQRSSADHALQIPYLLRTPEALLRTIEYIESELMDRAALGVLDPRIGEPPSTLFIYLFVWDRYRMVAKDFTLQQSVLPLSRVWVECHERMARWFILMDHRMQAAGDFISAGHGQQNGESLNNLLKTLHGHYFRSREVSSSTCTSTSTNAGTTASAAVDFEMPNKAEFVCYFVIFQLGNGGEVSKYLQQLPEEILNSGPVRFAIEVWGALKTQNYAKYFRLLKTRATLLQACLMHRYVGEVRLAALKKLARSLNPPGSNPQEYSLKDLTNLFMFESMAETVEFVEHCGLPVASSSTAASSSSGSSGADDSLVVLLSGQNIDQLLPRDKNDRAIPPATYYMGEWIDQRKSARPAGNVAPPGVKGTNFATHFTIAEVCRGFATGGSAPVTAPAPRAPGTFSASTASFGVRAPLAVTSVTAKSSVTAAPAAAASIAGLGTPADAHTTIDKAALRNKLLMSSSLSSGRGAKAATSPIAPITDADVWGPADSNLKGVGPGKKSSKDVKRESPAAFPVIPKATGNFADSSRTSPNIRTTPAVPAVTASDGSWRKKTVAPAALGSGGTDAANAPGPFSYNINAPSFAPSSSNQSNVRGDSGAGVQSASKDGAKAGTGFGQVSSTSSASTAPAPFAAPVFNNQALTAKITPAAAATTTTTAPAAPSTLPESKKLAPFGAAPVTASSFDIAASANAAAAVPVAQSFAATAPASSEGFGRPRATSTVDAGATKTPASAWPAPASAATTVSANEVSKPVVQQAAAPPLAANTNVVKSSPPVLSPTPEIVAPSRPQVNEAKVRAFEARVQGQRSLQVLRSVSLSWRDLAAKSAALRILRTKALYMLFWRQAHKRALQQRQSFIQDITSIKIVDSVIHDLGGMCLRGEGAFTSNSASNALKRKQSQQTEVDRLSTAVAREQHARLSLLCDGHSADGINGVQHHRGLRSLLTSVGETMQTVKTCQMRTLLGLPVAASTLRNLKANTYAACHHSGASTDDVPSFRGSLHFKIALVTGCATAGVVCNPPCTTCACNITTALRSALSNELGYGYTSSSSPVLGSTGSEEGPNEGSHGEYHGSNMSKNQLIKMKKRRGQLAKALSAQDSLPCVRIGLHSAAINAHTTFQLSVVDISSSEAANRAVPPTAKDSMLLEQVSAVSNMHGVQGAVIVLDTRNIGAGTPSVRKLFQCLQHAVPFVLIIADKKLISHAPPSLHCEEVSIHDEIVQNMLQDLGRVAPSVMGHDLGGLIQGCLLVMSHSSTPSNSEGQQRVLMECMQRAVQLLAAGAEPTPCVTRQRSCDWLRTQLSSCTVPSEVGLSSAAVATSGQMSPAEVRAVGHAALVMAIQDSHAQLESAVAALRKLSAGAANWSSRYPTLDFLPRMKGHNAAETEAVVALPGGLVDVSVLLGGNDSAESASANTLLPADWANPAPYESLIQCVSQLALPSWQSTVSIDAYQARLVQFFRSLHELTATQSKVAPLAVHAQSFVCSLETALNAALLENGSIEGLRNAIRDIVRDIMDERIAAMESAAAMPPFVYCVLDQPASLARLLADRQASPSSATDQAEETSQDDRLPEESPLMSPVAGAKMTNLVGSGSNYFEQVQYAQAFPTGFGRDSLFAQFSGYSHSDPRDLYASPVADPHRTKRSMHHDSDQRSARESKGTYDVNRLSYSSQHGTDGEPDGEAHSTAAFKRAKYSGAGDGADSRENSMSPRSDRAVQAFDIAFKATRSPASKPAVVDPVTVKLQQHLQAEQHAAHRLNLLLQQALQGGQPSVPLDEQSEECHTAASTRAAGSSTMEQDPMAFIEQCRREREHFERYGVQS